MTDHPLLYKPDPSNRVRMEITPESAGWDLLSFAVLHLEAGDTHDHLLADEETALVPLSGSATVRVGDIETTISRSSVFDEMPRIAYAPPGTPIAVVAGDDHFEFAIGSAPAEGRYAARIIEPAEMTSVLRGGGSAYRQVNNVLAPPVDAERLILYEVYVPRGTWSGWPPHCHDGFDNSPYLEETYYFRLDPANGYCIHRNWRVDSDYEDLISARDGECALVKEGYHTTVADPGSHMFFLNYQAGNILDGDRATPPSFLEEYTWINDDWDKDGWELPKVRP